MKKILNKYLIVGIVFIFLFLLLMVLLNFNKANLGETNTPVGLSSINKLFVTNYVDIYNSMSQVGLYLSFIIIIGFAITGFYQLIKRKSLFKVDLDIILFGVGVIVLIITWLLFDKIIAYNYRPIYVNKNLEGSFPSTHVLFTTFVLVSAFGISLNREKNNFYNLAILVIAILVITLTSLCRVLSGMHWATDVLGGLLLGLGYFFILYGIFKGLNKKEKIVKE